MTGSPTMSVLRTLLILWSLCYQPALGSIEDLPWPEAASLIQTVCPYGSVCELPPIKQGLKTTCCRGCSCDPDCTSNGNCCFPQKSASEDETCIFPRTRFHDKYVRSTSDILTSSFNIVTKSPRDGCVNGITEACDAGEASMAPVYSQETNKVYVNDACANCHGVGELIEWESALVCDRLGRSETVDFETEITNYLRNSSTSACFLAFFLHGNNNGVDSRRCLMPGFESMLDTRKDNSEIIIGLTSNLSMGAILDACKGNVYAPIKSEKKWYPNPFCFLYDERELRSPTCPTRAENVLGLDSMTLLDPRVKELLTSNDEKQGTSIPLACLKATSGSQITEHRPCRPVACPFGHILNQDGTCMFIGKKVYFKGLSSFSVHILLKRSTDHHAVKEPLTEEALTLDDIKEGVNVAPDWTVALVAVPSDQADDEVNVRDELLIQLQPIIQNSNEALATLKTHLTKSIAIWDGTRNRVYTQQIYPLPVSFAQTLTRSMMDISCSVEIVDAMNTDHPSSNSDKDISGHNESSAIGDTDDVSDDANRIQSVNSHTDKMGLDPNSDNGHISQAPNPDMRSNGLDAMSDLDTTDRLPLPSLQKRNQDAVPDIGTTMGLPLISLTSRNQGDTSMSGLGTTDQSPLTSIATRGQDGVSDLDIDYGATTASANAINDDDTTSIRRKRRTLRRMNTEQDDSVDGLTTTQKDGLDNLTPRSQDVLSVPVNDKPPITSCWKPLFTDFRVNSETIAITKLYFCDTIELMAGEFRLMANDSVLFVETHQVYLYENEFIILENSNKTKAAKVCLEDSGFVRSTASSAGKNLGFIGVIFVVQLLHIGLF